MFMLEMANARLFDWRHMSLIIIFLELVMFRCIYVFDTRKVVCVCVDVSVTEGMSLMNFSWFLWSYTLGMIQTWKETERLCFFAIATMLDSS